MLSVAIVADDLTGAMDAAAPFADRGMATRMLCRPDLIDPRELHGCGTVAVNVGSRLLEADRAAAQTADAARRLRLMAPAFAFKKIDSTLRGNVAAEVLAAAHAFERSCALLTPAFPAQGRIMRGGTVYVHGRPLRDTSFAGDRQAPPRDLEAAFRTLAPGSAVRPVPGAAMLPAQPPAGIVLCDCADEAELARIARWVVDRRDSVVAAGSAGLARALAAALPVSSTGPTRPPGSAGAALFVVGSRTPEAAAQVACLAGSRDDVLVQTVPVGQPDAGSALPASAGGAVIVLRAAPGEADRSSAAVAADLGQAARHLVERLPIGVVLLTGGDTALAVLDALGVAAVTVTGEVMPGLARASFTFAGRELTLVTKAGGFGDDEVLVRVLENLEF